MDWLCAGVTANAASQGEEPVAAVLGAGQAALIPDLRTRFRRMPIFLDLVEDTVEARAQCLCLGADDFWVSAEPPSDLLLRLRLHRSIQQRAGLHPPCCSSRICAWIPPRERSIAQADGLRSQSGNMPFCWCFFSDRATCSPVRICCRRSGVRRPPPAATLLEVYVRYLRQKLEAEDQSRLLHTVRGRGYCLGAERAGA